MSKLALLYKTQIITYDNDLSTYIHVKTNLSTNTQG